MRRVVVHPSGRDDLPLVRDAACPAHGHAVGLAEPIGSHALLRGHRVVPVVDTVAVQEGRRG